MTWQDHMARSETARFKAMKCKRDEATEHYRDFRLKVKSAAEFRSKQLVTKSMKEGKK
ncbi:MAG: hypothetical protein ACI84R_001878 [Candidatus Azotimanducaceae bacterium]|jgi:hypothetical protein